MGWAARLNRNSREYVGDLPKSNLLIRTERIPGNKRKQAENAPRRVLAINGTLTEEGEKLYELSEGGRTVGGIARYFRKLIRKTKVTQ